MEHEVHRPIEEPGFCHVVCYQKDTWLKKERERERGQWDCLVKLVHYIEGVSIIIILLDQPTPLPPPPLILYVGEKKNIKGNATKVSVPIMSLHFIHIESCSATWHDERDLHLDDGDWWGQHRETDILGVVPLAPLPIG